MINVYGNGTQVCLSTESTELQPITITNTGGQVITNVVVTVTVPAGLTYDSDNPSAGTYDSGLAQWTIPSVGVGNSATLDLCFLVSDDTLGPWEITYVAIHDDSADANPDDDAAERNIEGFSCSEFENCWELLPEYDSMAAAIAALGDGKMFLYTEDNLDGATYRGLHVTPFS